MKLFMNISLVIVATTTFVTTVDAETVPSEVVEQSGISGGLIVHLGCGDGKLTAAFRTGDGYLVHGLDADVRGR